MEEFETKPKIIQNSEGQNRIEVIETESIIRASPYSRNVISKRLRTTESIPSLADLDHPTTEEDLNLNTQLANFLADITNPEKNLVTPTQFNNNNIPLRKNSSNKKIKGKDGEDNQIYPM